MFSKSKVARFNDKDTQSVKRAPVEIKRRATNSSSSINRSEPPARQSISRENSKNRPGSASSRIDEKLSTKIPSHKIKTLTKFSSKNATVTKQDSAEANIASPDLKHTEKSNSNKSTPKSVIKTPTVEKIQETVERSSEEIVHSSGQVRKEKGFSVGIKERKSESNVKLGVEGKNVLERKKSSRMDIILPSKSYHSSASSKNNEDASMRKDFAANRPHTRKPEPVTSRMKNDAASIIDNAVLKPTVPLATVSKNVTPMGPGSPQSKFSLLKQTPSQVNKATVKHSAVNSKIPRVTSSQKSVQNAPPTEVNKKVLESQYLTRKKRFAALKKELEEKQKSILDCFQNMAVLREKVSQVTGKSLPVEEEIKVIEIASVSNIKALKPPEKMTGGGEERPVLTFNTKIMEDMNLDFTEFKNTFNKLCENIPNEWILFAKTLSEARTGLLTWVKQNNPETDLDLFHKESKTLVEREKVTGDNTNKNIEELCSEIKKLYSNREMLKNELKLANETAGLAMVSEENLQLTEKIKELIRELHNGNARAAQIEEQKEALESQVRQAKLNVKELELQIEADNVKMTNMGSQLKVMDAALKQKESAVQRASQNSNLKSKDLKDIKAKQELIEILESRIGELTVKNNDSRKQIETVTKELETEIEMREKKYEEERLRRIELEKQLRDNEEKFNEVRAKQKELTELAEKSKMSLPDPSKPNKREEQLWNELQTARVVVKGYQEKLDKLKEEKEKLILDFESISGDEGREKMEKYAAEIVKKDEVIALLKEQISNLRKQCDEHGAQYVALEGKLKEFQENVKKSGQAEQLMMIQQLREMREKVAEQQQMVNDLVTHNHEIESALTKKSMELEQRDRVFKHQSTVLKVRDDLIELLKAKDTERVIKVKELPNDPRWEEKTEKICKDLASKSQNIDVMQNLLQEKHVQIENLKRLVRQMEEQQERAQRQRVRFEAKIAELQKQLVDRKPKNLNKIFA